MASRRRAIGASTAHLLAAMVSVVACGDNAPAGAGDGARLALRRFTYEEGTVQIARGTYRDLARDEDCSPQRWSDGLRYCTPHVAETAYADAQCLTRVAQVPLDEDVAYAVERGIDDLIARIYRLGQPYASASTLAWKLENGRCTGPVAADEPVRFFQLGQEEGHEAFVHVERAVLTNDARLQVSYDASDDGMRSPIGFFDRERSFECQPISRPDVPSTECVPAQPTNEVRGRNQSVSEPESNDELVSERLAEWEIAKHLLRGRRRSLDAAREDEEVSAPVV